MEGGYKNKGNSFWNPSWEAWARNLCSDQGKIVVKVDVKNAKDKTWHLTGSEEREGSGYGRVRGVYYCKDLSHDDTLFDATPDLVLTPSSLSVSEGGSGSYTVALAGPPSAAVTVTIRSGSGVTVDTDADSNGNQNTLSFPTVNWNTPQTVVVRSEQDDDAVDETVTLSHRASGGDYGSVTADLSVTIRDDETAALLLTPSSLTVSEGGSDSYTVALASQPTATVTVTISSGSGVVTRDTDPVRNGNQNSLTFSTANWSTPQTVQVGGREDDDAVDDTVTLSHTASGGDYGSVTADLNVTVSDDETPALLLTPASLTVTEGGRGSYTVALASQPTDTVTVTISSGSGVVTRDTDPVSNGNQNTLTFSTANWSTPQTVQVGGRENDDAVDNTVTLSHTASGGDYGSVTADLNVTVAALLLTPSSLTVTEGGSGSYTVALASQPTDMVTVTVMPGSGVTVDANADINANQNTLSFTTANWSTPQTVEVNGDQDNNAIDETVTLAHTASGGDYGSVTANLSVAVTDDDKEPALVLTPSSLTLVGGGSGSYTVALASRPTATVTVSLSSGPGVTVDTDATTTGNQNTLSFSTANWSTPQTVNVSVEQDDDAVDDTVMLAHSASGGDYVLVTANLNLNVQNICERMDVLSSNGETCNLTSKGITSLSSGDFAELSNLKYLYLGINQLSSLPEDIFDGLSNLQYLLLGGNDLNSLPEDIFAELSDLQYLYLNNNNLSSLPEDIFAGLSDLDTLLLYNNDLSSLPKDIFDELSDLRILYLYNNDLSSLPEDVFDELSDLRTLYLYNNDLSSLPEDIFDGLSKLDTLFVSGNSLTCLPKKLPLSVTITPADLLRCGNLVLTPSSLTVAEGGSGSYTVALNSTPTATVTVTISAGQGVVTRDTDPDTNGNQNTLSFTTANWNTPQIVEVSGVQDDDAVDDTVTLSHSASGGDYGSATANLSVTVADDDKAPALVFTPESPTLPEAGSGSYTVALAGAPTAAVTVTVSPGSGVTLLDTDAATSGNQTSLSFTTANWNTPQTLTLSAEQDADAVDDTVTLSHTASGGDYGSVTASLSVTVSDDETPALVLTPSSLTLAEGGSGSYTMALASEPTAAVTVTVSPGAGVTLDTDAATSGNQNSLSFTTANWNTPQTLTLSAEQDADAVDDTVTLSHTASGGDYGSVTGDMVVTVSDDETAALLLTPSSLTLVGGGSGSYTMALASEPTAAVTVTVTSDPSAGVTLDADAATNGNQNSLSFTATNWSTPQTVDLSVGQDVDDTVTLSHSASGGDYGSVTANLSINVQNICERMDALNSNGKTCNLSSKEITSLNSGDFDGLSNLQKLYLNKNKLSSLPEDVFDGLSKLRNLRLDNNDLSSLPEDVFDGLAKLKSLNLNKNDLSSLPEDIFAGLSKLQNLRLHSNDLSSLPEDVFAGLSKLQNLRLHNNDLSSLPEDVFAGLSDLETLNLNDNGLICLPRSLQLSVTVDAELPRCGNFLTLTPSSLTVAEAGSGSYTVALASEPTAAVTVTVSPGAGVTLDTDAATDGNQTSLSFSTANWSTPQIVDVSAGQDDDAVDDTVTLAHSASGGDYRFVSGDLVVAINDDDKAPALVFSPESPTVAEGGSGSYTVRLAGSPSAAVTLTVTPGAGVTLDTDADTDGNQNTLSFSTANWNTPQTVEVSGEQDDDAVDKIVMLAHTASGGDYDSVAANLSVAITDDDKAPALVFTPESPTVVEGGSSSYTVRPAGSPSAAVTLTISAGAGVTLDTDADTDGNQTSLSFSAVNWNTPQTVEVSAEQDDDAVDDTVTLTHTASGGDYDSVTANLSVAITDDDKAPALVFTPESPTVAEGGSGSYTVALAGSPTAAVTVSISTGSEVTVDTDAATNGNQNSLSFTTANWNTPQTVEVSAGQDDDAVDDTVTLSHSTSGGDYDSVSGDLVVTVSDDDKAPALVLTPESLTVVEGDSGSYTVALAGSPTAAVTVTVTPGTGVTLDTDTATSGNQTTLNFTTANWNMSQTVEVSAEQDNDAADDTVTLSHSASGGDYGSVSGDLVVTVSDDEKTNNTNTTAALPPWLIATGTLEPLMLYVGGEDGSRDGRDAFSVDNDDAGEIMWRFASSNPAVASVPEEPSNNPIVMVTPVREGKATITVRAASGKRISGPASFLVTVVTSPAEETAIRAALSGQGRVILGSVTDMIGKRFDSGTGGTGASGSVCLNSAAGADGESATSDESGSSGDNAIAGSYGDNSDYLITSDSWQGESWNKGLSAMGLRGIPHVGQRDEDSMDKTFDDLLELFRGQPHSLHPADWAGECGSSAVAEESRPWTLWAGTDLQWARGGTDSSDFDGEWQLYYLGADRAFREQWLAGLSLSQVQGEVDYSFDEDATAGAGQLSSNLTAIYPYLHGQLSSNLELWAIGGIGFGDVENEREHVDGDADQGDLHMRLLSLGLRRPLSQAGSTIDLALTSDAGFLNLSAEGDGSLDGAEASIGRFRLGLELSRPFASGVEPFAQLHGRYDSGDGPTGAAGEVVLGLRYGDERFNLELRGNHLTSAAELEQWGAKARLDYSPATNGTGLNLALTSQWGAAENGDSFLDGHTIELPTPALVSAQSDGDSLPAEISGEIGYSLSMGQQWGILTPNLGYDHSDNGTSRSRVGLAYALSSDLDRDIELRLDLARRERRQEDPDHSIELSTTLRF